MTAPTLPVCLCDNRAMGVLLVLAPVKVCNHPGAAGCEADQEEDCDRKPHRTLGCACCIHLSIAFVLHLETLNCKRYSAESDVGGFANRF